MVGSLVPPSATADCREGRVLRGEKERKSEAKRNSSHSR
jgi:hypothetical protein